MRAPSVHDGLARGAGALAPGLARAPESTCPTGPSTAPLETPPAPPRPGLALAGYACALTFFSTTLSLSVLPL